MFWKNRRSDQYFKKGSRILIQGELVLNTWTDNNGNNRQEHSILIEKINFVDKKNQEQQTKQAPQETTIIYEQSGETQVIQNNNKNTNKNTAVIDIGDDEIPF